MRLSIKLRTLQILSSLLFFALVYGALYKTLPALREAHNSTLFRLTHQAVSTQASVIHVGAERHRQKSGYSVTPVFGIEYSFNGTTHLGFVKAFNSGSASEHSALSKEVNGKTFDILVDEQNPTQFYAQPNQPLLLQLLVRNLFWYMIVWGGILTIGHFLLKWIQQTRAQRQSIQTGTLNWSDFKIPMHWISSLGWLLGLIFWLYILLLPPWLPRNHAYSALSLQANQALLGTHWQRWNAIEYRFKGYMGGGNQCPKTGYVDALHMQWEIRWKHEDAPQALAQIQNITDTTYCNSMLAANQTIALNQTDNSFAGIINGRNAIETHADGYDYTNVELAIVYPRKSVTKNNAISIQLDATHTARFPLYLYVW